MNPPPGCRFHTRCPVAVARCRVEDPPLAEVAPGHLAACHLARELPPYAATVGAAMPEKAALRLGLYAARRAERKEALLF